MNLHRLVGNQGMLGLIRAKLKINQPDDPLEQEADRVADDLTAAPDAGAASAGGLDAAAPSREGVQPDIGADANMRLGSGFELDAATRSALEPGLGANFSSVRLHTGPEAERAAETLGARAFTAGSSVAFGRGEYSPGTTEGRRLIAHELTHVVQRSSPDTIHRKSPPELNYENLADRIHEAISGLGTDEEQVYLALQALGRDPDAIAELQRVYAERHKVSLLADIQDDFSGTELEYALQLLNMGTAGSAQEVGTAPSTPAELQASARRLRDAVEGLGTDEEAIYAVLLPMGRNLKLIDDLARAYHDLYSEDLSARLEDELSGSELNYALYLMGGPAMRANVEITEVSMAEATRLFQEMARLNFWTATDTDAPVPFHYPVDGCYDRAYVMEQRLTEMGYASEKVFAVSMTPSGGANLRVPTDYGLDTTGTPPAVRWWYHVAPVIQVRTAAGSVEEMVIDPSLASGPITIGDWAHMMNTGAFTRIPGSDIHSLLEANSGEYPTGRNITFTTGREVYYPPRLDQPTGPREASELHQGNRPRMTGYAAQAQVHELAAAIRIELRAMPISVDRIVAAINAASGLARSRLLLEFPNLRSEVLAVISDPADRMRIELALTAP